MAEKVTADISSKDRNMSADQIKRHEQYIKGKVLALYKVF